MTFETKKSLRKQLEAAIASAEGYQENARDQYRVSSSLREVAGDLRELVMYLAAELDILENYGYYTRDFIDCGNRDWEGQVVGQILRDYRRIKDARVADGARERLTPPSKDEE